MKDNIIENKYLLEGKFKENLINILEVCKQYAKKRITYGHDISKENKEEIAAYWDRYIIACDKMKNQISNNNFNYITSKNLRICRKLLKVYMHSYKFQLYLWDIGIHNVLDRTSLYVDKYIHKIYLEHVRQTFFKLKRLKNLKEENYNV